MNKCPKCGFKLSKNFNYCPSCGSAIGEENYRKNSSARIDGTPKPDVKVLLIIAVLIVSGFLMLYFSGVFSKEPLEVQNNSESGLALLHPDNAAEIIKLKSQFQKDTMNLKVILELANRLNDAGSYASAIEYYNRYNKIEPNNADVWVDLGVCFFELHDLQKAKENMLNGLLVDPRHQIAHLNLGIVSLSGGDRAEAVNWWRKAVRIDSTTETAIRAKELLNTHIK